MKEEVRDTSSEPPEIKGKVSEDISGITDFFTCLLLVWKVKFRSKGGMGKDKVSPNAL